jgi:hypothetical protein
MQTQLESKMGARLMRPLQAVLLLLLLMILMMLTMRTAMKMAEYQAVVKAADAAAASTNTCPSKVKTRLQCGNFQLAGCTAHVHRVTALNARKQLYRDIFESDGAKKNETGVGVREAGSLKLERGVSRASAALMTASFPPAATESPVEWLRGLCRLEPNDTT